MPNRYRLSRSCLLATTLLAGGHTVLSPDAASAQSPSNVVLDTIVVSGQQNGNARVSEAHRLVETSPTVSMERDEIEKLPNDRVSDVLVRFPGVVVSGPPGEKKNFSLRGLTPDYSRVQIDGLQLPSAAQSRSLELMNFPSFLVDQVAILRNPDASTEADGIAGRIALTTLRMPSRSGVEIRGALGGANTLYDGQHGQFGIAASHLFSPHFGVVAALNVDRRNVTKVKDFSEVTYQGGPGGAGTIVDQREPKNFLNVDGLLQAGWDWVSGSLVVRGLGLSEDVRQIGTRKDTYRRLIGAFNGRDRTDLKESTDVGVGSISLRQHVSPNFQILLDGAVSGANAGTQEEARSYNSALAFSSGSAEVATLTDRQYDLGAVGIWRFPWMGNHEVKFGASTRSTDRDYDREAYTMTESGSRSQTVANKTTSATSDYRARETLWAFFVQDRFEYDRFMATPGLRYEWMQDDLVGGLGSAVRNFYDPLPSIQLGYRVTDDTRLTLGVSRRINRPKLEEIAPGVTKRGPRTIEGDPNINPARAWAFDSGVAYVTRNLFLAANVFYRDIKDVIETIEISTNVFRARNAGDGWARGLELEQRVSAGLTGISWLMPLTLITNQTFLESRVNDPTTGPRPFTEAARFVSNWTLQWNDVPRGLLLSASLNYVSPRKTISNEGNGAIKYKEITETYFLDLKVEKKIAAGVSVYATAENLLNQKRDEFERTNGILSRTAVIATGRVFFAGAKGNF